MRERILIRNADAVVTCDPADRVLYNSDILICGNRIEAVGSNLAAGDAQIIDAAGKYVYPGLVNTHHHFFQAFVRNLMTIDRPGLTLMQWLDDIYKVFVRIDGDVIFYASAACMADLIKHGCTCSVDHQYCYTPAPGKQGVDRQMEAARLMGFRFVAARGTNTLPRWKGSTIPDEMCETTAEYLDDCQRLLALYHDPEPFSMRQIVLAPCQPINCTEDTFLETIRLARSAGVHMHTHLCEGKTAAWCAASASAPWNGAAASALSAVTFGWPMAAKRCRRNMLCWRKITWAFPTAPPPPCWAAARFWTSPVCARPAYP